MKPLTPLKAGIIAAGFVENVYQLDLNCALADPAPRYPKSRMFAWPISVDRHDDRLTICHAAMACEPFVARVMSTLGVACEIDPHPPGCHGTYHHAVDLANDRHMNDLIASAEYTTGRAIMRGIVINAMSGRLTTDNARVILGKALPDIAAVEPDDRSEHALSARGGILRPAFIDDNSGTSKPGAAGKGRWAVNLHSRRDPVAELWATIHGIEEGYFKRDKRGDYHQMSPTGLARHMGVPVP